jgi:hypothetical protein
MRGWPEDPKPEVFLVILVRRFRDQEAFIASVMETIRAL